ncbi:MAG: acyl-CoA thioesterase [Polyangiaceae bacterium]
MTEFVLPTHANALGTVFGGQILAWMDLCAAICVQRYTNAICVTAGIDDLSFEEPIRVGEVVRLAARVTAAFRSSIEVLVDVRGEDTRTGRTWQCVRGYLTFVSLDHGKPTRVPPLLLDSDEDRAFAAAAAERRSTRLARRANQRG